MKHGLIAIDVVWRHDFDAEPVRLVSVLDRNRYEICKLEFFRDGRVGFADEMRSALGTQLGLLPVPSLTEINADPQFEARETTTKAFEMLWSRLVTGLIIPADFGQKLTADQVTRFGDNSLDDLGIPPTRMTMDIRDSEPAWMPVAIAECGVRRFPVGETNPRIVEYNNQTSLFGYDDKISWCSSFINWCLAGVGVRGTRSALARSWLDWGVALDNPIYGCVTVLTRDDPTSWKGHVGFYLRHDEEFVYLLGGNQLDEVRELAYPVASVLGYRWPERSG